jgi:NAD(P)-dependent dehydrogenase (short-subunit alcohol dehydrogenase family)
MILKNAIALVTGANQGLGKCYTEELLRLGAAKVYACGLTLQCLDAVCERHGDRIVPLKLDVTEHGDIDDAVRAAPDLTVLVNNAGVLEAKGLVEAGSLDVFRREMEVNVFGLANMSLAFAPVISGNGGGAIINMLSAASLANFPPFGTYCATKAAAMSITHDLRYELKGGNIEVFGIYAGLIDTDMLKSVGGEKSDPRDIAASALAGVEAGIMDIDADARTERLRLMVKENPETLEVETHIQADRYYKTQSM